MQPRSGPTASPRNYTSWVRISRIMTGGRGVAGAGQLSTASLAAH